VTDAESHGWRPAVEVPCTICRREGGTLVYTVDGHPIVRCPRCSLLYVSPRPDMREVVAIYGDEYFENPAFQTGDADRHFGYADYLRDGANTQIRFRQILRRVERHGASGAVLDVGCGPGLFLDVAQRAGWDAWGVDLNEAAIEWASEHVTEHVAVGSIEDLDAKDEQFDCITMFDVIEHLDDPRARLLEVARVLRPGGVLVVATPDAGALVPRLLRSNWLEMKRAPEHLHFFSAVTLAALLELSGFTPIEWHSFGKVSSVRNLLAELRFYSTRAVGVVERALDAVRIGDVVIDADPRTKLCMYARKTGDPLPLDEWRAPRPFTMRRTAADGLGRIGVHRTVLTDEDRAQLTTAPGTGASTSSAG